MTIKFSLAIADERRLSEIEKKIRRISPNVSFSVSQKNVASGYNLPHITIELETIWLPSVCLAFFHAGINFANQQCVFEDTIK